MLTLLLRHLVGVIPSDYLVIDLVNIADSEEVAVSELSIGTGGAAKAVKKVAEPNLQQKLMSYQEAIWKTVHVNS